MFETLNQLDQQLMLSLNSMHAPYWDCFMWLVSAKLTWAGLYATLLYVLFRNFNWRTVLFTLAAIALTITFADQVCASLIRPEAARLRPSNLDNPLSEFIHVVNSYRGGRYGFPSCHAANTFGLAFFVLFVFRNMKLNLLFFSWALMNCYSRIYLGVHYPGDLLAGTLVGYCCALLVYRLWKAGIASFPALLRIPEEGLPEKGTEGSRTCIYAGLLTLAVIAVYSAFSLI